MSGNNSEKIGVLLRSGGFLGSARDDFRDIVSSVTLIVGVAKEDVIQLKEKGPGLLGEIGETVKKRNFTKIVVGGFSPAADKPFLTRIAAEAGLAEGSVAAVPAPSAAEAGRAGTERYTRDIAKAFRRLEALGTVEVLSLSASKHVCVVGSGVAGTTAACELAGMGFSVTLIESAPSALCGGLPEGIELLSGSHIERLEGSAGNFTVTIAASQAAGAEGLRAEKRTIHVGAVILAPEQDARGAADSKAAESLSLRGAVPAAGLAAAVRELPRKQEIRNIGIVLDLETDETPAGSGAAFAAAREIQEAGNYQVYLFCRDVRVAELPLEEQYDTFRDSGGVVVKYSALSMRTAERPAGTPAVQVNCFDENLGAEIIVACELIGISEYGLSGRGFADLAERTGVALDRLDLLQENNVHLLPYETNRPGICAAGACRGTYSVSAAVEEAKGAALAIRLLLEAGEILTDTLNARVDPDKCVLCLTCIRSCPHKAMFINRERGAADSYPQACRRCGICVGECPAKAITLPAYSDEILMESAVLS